jgi:hypothetical protein
MKVIVSHGYPEKLGTPDVYTATVENAKAILEWYCDELSENELYDSEKIKLHRIRTDNWENKKKLVLSEEDKINYILSLINELTDGYGLYKQVDVRETANNQ